MSVFFDFEILNEADMPYFRNLASQGNAVIMEIPENVILDLDMEKLEKRNTSSEFTAEALLDFLLESKKEMQEIAEMNRNVKESL